MNEANMLKFTGVGIPGSPTAPPVTISLPTVDNRIQTPQSTQHGMVNDCNAFLFVHPEDRSQAVVGKVGISLAQLFNWKDVDSLSYDGLM